MNENKTKKAKRAVRRFDSKTFKRQTIFKAFCRALSLEKWQGALMLFDLHEFNGKMSDIEYELRNLASGLDANGDNPPLGPEKKGIEK